MPAVPKAVSCHKQSMTEFPDPARFSHVTDWVFDLDNTLYPHHSNLFSQIDVKMTAYVSELLSLSREDARRLQKELYLEYGTTLSGLMARHGIDPDDFLQKVHDIDYSWLVPDPTLGAAIRQLPGRKFIFTNGDRGHASFVGGPQDSASQFGAAGFADHDVETGFNRRQEFFASGISHLIG